MVHLDQNVLSHRRFFVPWTDEPGDPIDEAVVFARTLAATVRVPLVVAATTLANIPDELRTHEHVTERSSTVRRVPRVVVAIYPSWKLLLKAAPTGNDSYFVGVEWPDDPLLAWSMFNAALDLSTGQTLADPLDGKTREVYDRILWNGNNIWMNDHGKQAALRDIRRLHAHENLDRDLLLGYVLHHKKSDAATKQLAKLIDQVQPKPDVEWV